VPARSRECGLAALWRARCRRNRSDASARAGKDSPAADAFTKRRALQFAPQRDSGIGPTRTKIRYRPIHDFAATDRNVGNESLRPDDLRRGSAVTPSAAVCATLVIAAH
jgi:hypothetical protein